ncbi:General stress protein 69 [Luteitalea pratensis]|uniref:General stress protein 69 n=1 Tax=Luteitalea pratensis TaxID=1855912 RepID=A0A143PPM2_LUTPR|nr:aldo/keto reductase [Luteitalea pratensis]AMY10103.1 General stress protein 69 [Luteitalea pratensis]
MQTRQLGRTDLHITAIGFGAWAIGGEWRFGWGPQDDTDSIAAIRQAVSRGMNWIDTAPAYGLGHSEEVVASALADIPRADRPYVFTKCSLVWGEDRVVTHDVSGPSIRREVEESLRRLQMDAIDLYQIHWPRWHSAPAPSPGSVAEAWETLADLKQQGKVRHIGVSNFTVNDLETAEAIAPVGSLQPPYSMLRRGIEADLLPYCRDKNIGVLGYSPMLSGLLTGAMTRERIAALADSDWRRNNKEFQEPQLSANLVLVDLLRAIGARHGRSAGEVAIAWTLRHPVVTAAIVGGRSAAQVDGVVGAAGFTLSSGELAEIEHALPRA